MDGTVNDELARRGRWDWEGVATDLRAAWMPEAHGTAESRAYFMANLLLALGRLGFLLLDWTFEPQVSLTSSDGEVVDFDLGSLAERLKGEPEIERWQPIVTLAIDEATRDLGEAPPDAWADAEANIVAEVNIAWPADLRDRVCSRPVPGGELDLTLWYATDHFTYLVPPTWLDRWGRQPDDGLFKLAATNARRFQQGARVRGTALPFNAIRGRFATAGMPAGFERMKHGFAYLPHSNMLVWHEVDGPRSVDAIRTLLVQWDRDSWRPRTARSRSAALSSTWRTAE